MIKKTIKYIDFNGEEHTEDFYFNITRAEALKFELSGEGNSWGEQLKRIGQTRNGRQIMDAFEEFLRRSYGIKSEDGKSFIKSPELFEDFKATAAYSELFIELTTDSKAGAEFINGIFPKGMADGMPTAPQTARERSEASLQGYKKKADHEGSDIINVPELPTVGPDLEHAPKDVTEKTLDELNEDELRARLAALQAARS